LEKLHWLAYRTFRLNKPGFLGKITTMKKDFRHLDASASMADFEGSWVICSTTCSLVLLRVYGEIPELNRVHFENKSGAHICISFDPLSQEQLSELKETTYEMLFPILRGGIESLPGQKAPKHSTTYNPY